MVEDNGLDEWGLVPECPVCRGEGLVPDPEGIDNPDWMMVCPACGGTGDAS